MEILVGVMELMFFADIAWLVIGVPVLAVLGGLTLAGTLRGRSLRSGDTDLGTGTGTVLGATPAGRRALVLAVWVIGLAGALGLLIWVSAGTAAEAGSGMTALAWAIVVGMVALNLSIGALVIMLILAARDVLRGRRTAGRDTWVAYGLMAAAHTGMLGLALSAGVFRSVTG